MIEFFAVWLMLIVVFLLRYFARRAFEISNSFSVFKRIISDKPIETGNLTGRYVVEGLDGNIHYVFPPITVTLGD